MSEIPDLTERALHQLRVQAQDERRRRESTEDRLKEAEEEVRMLRDTLHDMRLNNEIIGGILVRQQDHDQRLKELESAARLAKSKDMLRG